MPFGKGVRTSATWRALQEERLLLAHSQRGGLQGALHRRRPNEAMPRADAAAACAVGVLAARQQQAGHFHMLRRRRQPSYAVQAERDDDESAMRAHT